MAQAQPRSPDPKSIRETPSSQLVSHIIWRSLCPSTDPNDGEMKFSYDTSNVENLLMPLFLMGCFPMDFQEAKRPLRTKSVKRPIKVGKRPINEGKRPIKAMVLVGISVGCLMGCFRAPPPWRKTAPLKRPIKRSMKMNEGGHLRKQDIGVQTVWVRESESGEES